MTYDLLLGCGHSRKKHLIPPAGAAEFDGLITVDINPACNPDILIDLQYSSWDVLGDDDCYDEIHAYEVLEHLGRQGDLNSFFYHFHQLWRMLKPDGYLCASVPSRFSPWLWGDPGHHRAILPETLIFLDQSNYAQIGHTAMSDYRANWLGDFKIIKSTDDRVFHWFILQAIKPRRVPA